MPKKKKDRSIYQRINDIIQNAKKLEIFMGDLEAQKLFTDVLQASLKEELDAYEREIGESSKKFIKQLQKISEDVGKLKTHTSDTLGIPERTVEKVNAVIEGIRQEVQKNPESSVKEVFLPHIDQLTYAGVKSILENPDNFVWTFSKTEARKLILMKTRTEVIESPYDAEFVIGIVNCPVTEPLSDLILSSTTLKMASHTDIEVFDVMHELARCGYKFALGILAFRDFSNPPVITNSYNLTQLMKDHQETTQAKSLLIRVIAESKNLQHETSFGKILSTIPFEHLVKNGAQEICLDMLSCNTVEMMKSAMKQVEEIAKKYQIKMTANFYDGFVQNNISYCYISSATQQKILVALEGKMGSETDPAIPFSDFTATDATSVVRDSDGEFKKFKSDVLLQVVYPGLSLVAAKDSIAMGKFVVDKSIRGSSASVSESADGESPESPAAAAASRHSAEVFPAIRSATTRVMVPVKGEEGIPRGRIISCSVDYRVKAQEHSAAAAASDDNPSPEVGRRGGGAVTLTTSLTQNSRA